MSFQELDGERTRRLIDAEQRYSTYRDALRKLHQSYRGSMRWKRVKDGDYLYHTVDKIAKSLGPRTAETEKMESAFNDGRRRLRGSRRPLLRERRASGAALRPARRHRPRGPADARRGAVPAGLRAYRP